MNWDELLQYQQSASVDHIVLTYHYKDTGISKFIHQAYKSFIKNFPESKNILQNPPFISHWQTKSIKNIIVQIINQWQRSYWLVSWIHYQLYSYPKTCKIENESVGEPHVIYVAECTKCCLLCVAQAGEQLHFRFNGHRSEIQQRIS